MRTLFNGKRVPTPKPGAKSATTPEPCACGSDQVEGRDMQKGHDRYTSAAYCIACGDHRGALVVVVDTMWGIEEDEAVTKGRARCYP